MQNTLVTGGTGLVGYNIIQSLLKRGRPVKALVRSAEKARSVLPASVELIQGDITEPVSIARAIEDCTVVYHAAGLPEQWLKDPGVFTAINVVGTKNLIEAAVQARVRRFIYTSTIDVFAAAKKQTYDESVIDDQPKPTYYERSKQAADKDVVAALDRGLNAVFLHPSALYGPGPETSPGLNHLIKKLIANQVPVLLPGGMPVVYAPDVGEGHVLAEEKANVGSRYILSESYYDLVDLAQCVYTVFSMSKSLPFVLPLSLAETLAMLGEAVAKLINKPPLIPKGQLQFLQWQAKPSHERAKRDLGWQPTTFVAGLKKYIKYCNYPALY